MEHIITRCKHCGTVYTYCTYGNDDGCTDEYCGICATAIKNALKNIPRRYERAKQMIEDEAKLKEINKIFDQEKEDFYNSKSTRMVKVIPDWGYETVENCFIDKVEYYRCTDKNGKIDIYAFMEYDIIDKKFTGREYFENNNPRKQYVPISQMKFDLSKKNIEVFPMEKPTGKIFFDF